MTLTCPKCHSDNPDDTVFCGKCGSKFPSQEDIVVTETIEAPKEELTRGATLANRYEIIEELGKGGMGRVYRVEDTKLEQEVALKLIKPEIAKDRKTIERFRNELKLARNIRHKNVCGMFDLGETGGAYFITMEYIRGEDLKSFIHRSGQLAIGTTIKIAKQVCEGLLEAHNLDIVHRDLKSNNIMIDKEGNVRIMDFGIARSLESKGITGAGVMIGTPEYMSPEQVEGKEVDQRSDIYSLGIILYEMVTGKVPFEGDTPFTVGMKHKSEIPQNPMDLNTQISDDLNRVILRCLEKEKEKRYQNVGEIHGELVNIEKGIPTTERLIPERKPLTSKEITVTFRLRKIFIPALVVIAFAIAAVVIWRVLPKKEAVAVPPSKPSIAVLPFVDLSPHQNQEYFCDGMTDEIIAKLSRLDGWKVIPRTSMMRFKNTTQDIKNIGQELGVTAILEGSVRKEKEDLRIIATLINVADSSQLWSDTYNQKLESVFMIQNDLAQKITQALKAELTPEEKKQIQARPTENIEAYNLYLQGRWFLDKRERGFSKAIESFGQAIEREPDFALAYAGLADSYMLASFYGKIPRDEAYKKGKRLAEKALELDEKLGEAHTTLGLIKMTYLDRAGGEAEYKRAIELNPNFAPAHHQYSYLLSSLGRHKEAIQEAIKAQELDPFSAVMIRGLGNVYFNASDYDRAIDRFNMALEFNPESSPAYLQLFLAYNKKMMHREAINALERYLSLTGFEDKATIIEKTYSESGYDEALRRIAALPTTELDLKAYIYSLLAEGELALECSEKAYEEQSSIVFWLINPAFDSLRSDPRFHALLKKMGLAELL